MGPATPCTTPEQESPIAGLIAPAIKWPGGKHYLAADIVARIPPHLHYVEPYFGGGSVLFAKDPQGVSEVVNDLDGGLVNFWTVLRDDFEEFSRLVSATPFGEPVFKQAQEMLSQPVGRVHRAWAFFVRCRQSMMGMGKSFAPLSRNRVRRGMNEQASAWMGAVEGLTAVHARLSRVVILCGDALDVIRRQDGPNTFFYLDPPYFHDTRVSKDLYECEMSKADHVRLLKVLRGLKGKFLLSGYPSKLYDQCAKAWGWTRHDIEIPNNMGTGDTKRKMVESLWANY